MWGDVQCTAMLLKGGAEFKMEIPWPVDVAAIFSDPKSVESAVVPIDDRIWLIATVNADYQITLWTVTEEKNNVYALVKLEQE